MDFAKLMEQMKLLAEDDVGINMAKELEVAWKVEEWNNRKPVPRPHKDPISTMKAFDAQISAKQSKLKTYIPVPGHFCSKPLDQLKPITLNQMEVPKIHKGHFLVCRVASKVRVVVGTSCVIKDRNGDVEYLTLYNFHSDLNNADWLKRDTILIIKEPYLKYSSTLGHTEQTYIRVESPSDVIFVHETQQELLRQVDALCWYKPETSNGEALKESGNRMFNQGKYEEALDFYKRSLATNPSSEIAGILHLNMAAVLLQQERFYEANNEVEIAMQAKNINREKALFRLGKAAYGMRDWDKAEEWFKQLIKEFPDSKEATEWLVKVEARQKEAMTGEYDMMALYKLTKAGDKNMDSADYIGPIEVADILGKGKGLIATKNVPRGTLLAATKAYAYCVDKKDKFLNSLNLITTNYEKSNAVHCIIQAIQKLKRNPQTAKQLYALYAGPGMDRGENIPEGVIDAGRIERICSLSAYDVDDVTIRAEVLAIVSSKNKPNAAYASELDDADENTCALWLLPSFANHSCLANGTRVMYGDMFFLYAGKDLKKGEEVTLHYADTFKPYAERQQYLKKWQFQCKCRLCELDSLDPEKEKKRIAILERREQIRSLAISNPKQGLGPIKELVEEMRQTYNGREYRVQLYSMLSTLGNLYRRLGNCAKAVECSNESIGILADLNLAFTLQIRIALMQMYIGGFKPPKLREAKQELEAAIQDAKVYYGVTDAKMFGRIFAGIPGLRAMLK